MADQTAIQRLSPLDQGSVEGVPSRQTGKEDKGLLSPTQDKNTEDRRAHYGEEDIRIKVGRETDIELKVNQIPTPNNPTRDSRIQGDNSDTGHETGFGRASVQ
jgi:hypothetical protein